MIKYGLKLWSSNTTSWLEESVDLCQRGVFDFVEVYNNIHEPLDYKKLEILKSISVPTVHNPHSHGWHDFFLTEEQKPHWKRTVEMADFFGSENIIVHPPRTHDVKTLQENLAKLGDKRIILESMPGLDIDHQVMQCGQTLEDLKEISKQNGICFDLAKSFKASRHQKLDYQEFVTEALKEIKPKYNKIANRVEIQFLARDDGAIHSVQTSIDVCL